MSSSERARLILFAVWFVATMVLASAQLRVLAGAAPRARRYMVAWFVSTLVLGGLLFLMDRTQGAITWGRQLMNASIAGVVSATGLGAGALLTRQERWQRLHGSLRFLALAIVQAMVVALVGYPLL